MATGPGHSPEGLGGQEGSAKPRYLLVDLRGLDAAQIGGVLDRTEQRGVPAAFVPEGFAAALGRLSFRTPEAATEDGPLATWEDLWRFMDPQLSDRELRRGSTAIWNVLSDMYWRRVKAAQAGELSRPRGDVEELADDLLSVLFQTSGDGEQHIDLGILHAMLAPLPGRGRSVIADFGVLREGQITALSAFVNEQLKLEGDEALPT